MGHNFLYREQVVKAGEAGLFLKRVSSMKGLPIFFEEFCSFLRVHSLFIWRKRQDVKAAEKLLSAI